jgi:transcription antitermination factor NusG
MISTVVAPTLYNAAPRISVPQWYALHTRAKHERKVAIALAAAGIEFFLPLLRRVHRWSDRFKVVELPIFPCYVFARTCVSSDFRRLLFKTGSVIRVLGNDGQGTPVPDEEVESVRRVLDNALPVVSHPFVKIGQRVRVRGGALHGLEGVLAGHNGGRRLVLSINAIQRSIAITLEGYDLEPI